jgi:3-hydroxybutyryl-CoA dehydratase
MCHVFGVCVCRLLLSCRFGQRVVHGILVSSLFSRIFGLNIPGAVYLDQTLKFTRPVFLGDVVTATCLVTNVDLRRKVITCSTTVVKQECETVCVVGEARVLIDLLQINEGTST